MPVDSVHVAQPREGSMPRSMVGLLAAAGVAMSELVAFAHGDLVWVTIADAAAASGLAAYLALPSKKISRLYYIIGDIGRCQGERCV